jgi:2-iminobutanoate/2-iminopropanoate deaminase
MVRRIVRTPRAPNPVGPFSQAAKAANFVFVAGQGGLDPKTNRLVKGGIKEQTKQTLENIRNILEASGANLDQVVQVRVFLKEPQDFKAMNEVYSTYFRKDHPARTTIATTFVVEGGLVEIDAIAYVEQRI